jgi:hypothetical protein
LPVRAFAEPPHLDAAAALLAAAPVDVIAYGFTSSAYVNGVDAEAAMIARLAPRTRGIAVVAASAATVAALRESGCRRIAHHIVRSVPPRLRARRTTPTPSSLAATDSALSAPSPRSSVPS